MKCVQHWHRSCTLRPLWHMLHTQIVWKSKQMKEARCAGSLRSIASCSNVTPHTLIFKSTTRLGKKNVAQ